MRTQDLCWEIHCHGGSIAVSRICRDLEAAGLQLVVSSQTTEETLSQQIARVTEAALLKCRTRKTAGLVLAQQDGRLLRFAEDLLCDSEDRRNQAQEYLKRWHGVAEHLTRPWRVAIVGEPNVGKSSLINAIAGLQRSIVSEHSWDDSGSCRSGCCRARMAFSIDRHGGSTNSVGFIAGSNWELSSPWLFFTTATWSVWLSRQPARDSKRLWSKS